MGQGDLAGCGSWTRSRIGTPVRQKFVRRSSTSSSGFAGGKEVTDELLFCREGLISICRLLCKGMVIKLTISLPSWSPILLPDESNTHDNHYDLVNYRSNDGRSPDIGRHCREQDAEQQNEAQKLRVFCVQGN
jgi:hypothetical protein